MFTNIVARWPGSCHDSDIFCSSNICQYLEENHNSLDDGVILGDSGYACSPFLMTPYSNPESPEQNAYNSAHTKTRVVIEQTFGRWKRRFHVLHSEIRMAPEKVCLMIGACAICTILLCFLMSLWKMEICQMKLLKWKFMMGPNKVWPSEITFATHFLADHLYLTSLPKNVVSLTC